MYQVNAPYIGLKDCRVGLSMHMHVLLSNLEHISGPKYLKECLPYCTLLTLGRKTFLFLK